MDVAEWQARLEEHFTEDGRVGGRVMSLFDAERAYGEFVARTFHGYLVLTDSFQAFCLETLQTAETQWRARDQARVDQWYGLLLLNYVSAFRTFRAAENLLLCGYPLSSLPLFRDLKERALVYAAIASGVTTYERANGLARCRDKQLTESDLQQVRKDRKTEEKRIFKKMMGSESGLNPRMQKELEHWQAMFDMEVHGGRFTVAFEGLKWLKGEAALPIYPDPDTGSFKMHLNRSHEVAWMLLRTLPLLQIGAGAFGSSWAQRWHVLDDSFRAAVKSLADQGKEVFEAIIHLVDNKFGGLCPETTAYPGC